MSEFTKSEHTYFMDENTFQNTGKQTPIWFDILKLVFFIDSLFAYLFHRHFKFNGG